MGQRPEFPDGRQCTSCHGYYPEDFFGYNERRKAVYKSCFRCRLGAKAQAEMRAKLREARRNQPRDPLTLIDRWLRMPLN